MHGHRVAASTHQIMVPLPLADAAYTRLRNMILSGELPPACAITENVIAERLAIGKTPVRETMRRLVVERFLDVTPRMGYTVAGISRQDVDDLYQLRIITEVAAADLAMDRVDRAALDRLSVLSSPGYDTDSVDSMVAYTAVNAEFHDIIGYASGNQRLADLIARLMMESLRFVQIANLSGDHGRAVMAQHRAIVDALQAGDRTLLADAVRQHVQDSWTLVTDVLDAAEALA